MHKCIFCGEEVNPDFPLSVRHINPLTLRKGWMHYWCGIFAEDEAKELPSTSDEYRNRYQQYVYFKWSNV